MYIKVHGDITHEAGDMSEWTTATNATASTTGAITGTYSGRAGAGAAAAVTMTKNPINQNIGGRCSRVYATANWRPRQTPVGGIVNILNLGGSFGNAMGFSRRDTGNIYISGSSTEYSGISNGTAYFVELIGLYDGVGRLCYTEVWIDGVKRLSQDPGTTFTTTAADYMDRLDGPNNGGAGKITQDDCIDDVNVYVSDPWS